MTYSTKQSRNWVTKEWIASGQGASGARAWNLYGKEGLWRSWGEEWEEEGNKINICLDWNGRVGMSECSFAIVFRTVPRDIQ